MLTNWVSHQLGFCSSLPFRLWGALLWLELSIVFCSMVRFPKFRLPSSGHLYFPAPDPCDHNLLLFVLFDSCTPGQPVFSEWMKQRPPLGLSPLNSCVMLSAWKPQAPDKFWWSGVTTEYRGSHGALQKLMSKGGFGGLPTHKSQSAPWTIRAGCFTKNIL